MSERSPNIGHDLLSSRVGLKFYMSESCAGAGKQGKRWSVFKPVAESLKNLCLSGWESKDEVMSVPDRYAPPEAPSDIPTQTEINYQYQKLIGQGPAQVSLAFKWAVCVNMALNQNIASSSVSDCLATVISFGHKRDSPNETTGDCNQRKPGGRESKYVTEVYLVAEKVRTTLQLLPCTLQPGSATRTFTVNVPLQFTTSHEVLSRYFNDVQRGKNIFVSALGVSSFGSTAQQDEFGILRGHIGPMAKIMNLAKPSQDLLRKLTKTTQTKTQTSNSSASDTKGPLPTHETNQANNDTQACGPGEDAAAEGFNLLLEEAEQAISIDQVGGDGGELHQQDDEENYEINLAEKFYNQELRVLSGHDGDQLDEEADMIAEEAAQETGEREMNQHEQQIIDKLSQNNPSINMQAADSISTGDHLTFDEKVGETILNDRWAFGNFDDLCNIGAKPGERKTQLDDVWFLTQSLTYIVVFKACFLLFLTF